MSFIQGNINSKEDLIEAMNAMRGMLTQGDYKTELELELAEVEHKLAGIKGPELGGDTYAYVGILHALKDNLESRIQKLEEADKGPQETGYDDFEDEEPTESVSEWDVKKFLEEFSEKAYGSSKANEPEEDEDDDAFEELSSEEFLNEILDRINARTQAEVDKLRNNP
jgi:hypothetical protein